MSAELAVCALFTLDRAAPKQPLRVVEVLAPAEAPQWRQWLEEIGFLPDEPVMVLARAPGGDPLMVRVGTSTFALRGAEAACVRVEPLR